MRVSSPVLICAVLIAAPIIQAAGISPQHPAAVETTVQPADAQVRVCVDLDANVASDVLMTAQRTATLLFEGIGVHVHFLCDRSPEASGRQILLRLSDRTNPALLKHALGFARPFAHGGVRVTIFYDRVEEMQPGGDGTGIVLGHIMTHELTHVLEAQNAHTESGIMRSRWNDGDFRAMRMGGLYFSDADIRAIYGNLAAFLRP
jgi:hypothetical protein